MRHALLAASVAALVAVGGSTAVAQQGPGTPPSPYQKGGGQSLVVNGVAMPRDLVFRFLPVTLPLADIRVTSLYGMRTHPILGYSKAHRGVDFAGRVGTPAHSTAAGVVTFAGKSGAYGNMVEVSHGLGFSTRYGHLDAVAVAHGQAVDRNTVVGTVGKTGRVTGPHLHYEIRKDGTPLDPIAFVLKAYELYHHLN